MAIQPGILITIMSYLNNTSLESDWESLLTEAVHKSVMNDIGTELLRTGYSSGRTSTPE